jgi:hypothetical protein
MIPASSPPKKHKPASWVLSTEPDLRPNQVWMLFLKMNSGFPFRTPILANTAEEALSMAPIFQGTAQFVISEEELTRRLDIARHATAHVTKSILGRAGTKRFGFVFFPEVADQSTNAQPIRHPLQDVVLPSLYNIPSRDSMPTGLSAPGDLIAWSIGPKSSTTVRLVWVDAANERAARRALIKLGEKREAQGVIDVENLIVLRDELSAVRENRGDGARGDGRIFEDQERRYQDLTVDKLPGGQAEFDETGRWLDAILKKAATDREFRKLDRSKDD